jgi:metallo-beta-lactamase family protein
MRATSWAVRRCSLCIDDGERVVRLSFTGDVGRYVDRLLPEPMPFPQADYLICESTYGDRDHAPIAEAEEELLRHVHAVCVEQGGRLIIPAFSIGKTQEILYTLNSLSNAGRLPRVPVFVDSPLAISATEISRRYAELFREAVRAELRRDPDLFSFHGVEFVRSPERSKQLNGMKRPCIVIAASGMMEAGRVRHHLLHACPTLRNGVLAVGFCAHGTLGADIARWRAARCASSGSACPCAPASAAWSSTARTAIATRSCATSAARTPPR